MSCHPHFAVFAVTLALSCEKSDPLPTAGESVPVIESPVTPVERVSDVRAVSRDGSALRACPASAPGPSMVEFGAPGGLRYCMDQTEVTQRQYTEFLAANVDPATQIHPLCGAGKNPDFSPRAEEPPCNVVPTFVAGACAADDFDPEARGDEAVTCVDFCDAAAYCAWAGKRLCGVPGKPGRTLGDGFDEASEFRSALTASASHFHNACSERGSKVRPYAAAVDADACSGRKTVGSRLRCSMLGKNGAVYDLMGGVAEWQDSCTDDGRCRALGGMLVAGEERGSCEQDGVFMSGAANPTTGFRCCADLASEQG
jgi:formylglycine-generating enzyme